jgi:hypothetical protein
LISEPAHPEARSLDFWLGAWELTWPAEQTGGERGATMTGSNRIERVLGDRVIEENFTAEDGLTGRSLSVFDEREGIWRQTWVDDAGGFIVLSGRSQGDEMILSTAPVVRDGEALVNRMVFSDITGDSLLWRWQVTSDDGASWRDLWTITYRRRASPDAQTPERTSST